MHSGGLSGHAAGAAHSKLMKTPAHDGSRFRPGDVVKAHFLQGQWYLATIEQDNRDGTFVVEWLDGEQSDRRKSACELRLMRFHDGQYEECEDEQFTPEALFGAGPEEELHHSSPFRTGDIVKAHYRHGQFYLATVERVNGDGTCKVAWFDGDTSEQAKQLDELTLMHFDTELARYVEVSLPLLPQEPSTGCPTENDGSSAEEGQVGDEGARASVRPSSLAEQPGRLSFSPPARAPVAGGEEAPEQGRSTQLDAVEDATAQEELAQGPLQSEVAPDLSELDHWVALGDVGVAVHESPDKNSAVVGTLARGDVIVQGSLPADLTTVGSEQWLPLTTSTKVYRKGARRPLDWPPGGGYVDAQELELRRAVARHFVLRFTTGFGEPWVVLHDRVLVRSGPTVEDNVLGYMSKGDVVGVKSRTDDWVELVADADVRLSQGLHSVRRPREIIATRSARDREYRFSASPAVAATVVRGKLWMMVTHPQLGRLLQQCQEPPAGLDSTCALSKERRSHYDDVVGLVHRRIYEDNLEELWEGDREKLPSVATLERKLFESDTTVVRATFGDAFAGGAIMRTILVRAKAGSDIYSRDDDGGVAGLTTVGYIDSYAAVPGMHAGSTIWGAISSMDFVCVACHSILLEGTVKFWKSRGFLNYDSSKEDDRQMFKDDIRVRTFGRVVCELADLEASLPSSKLPLMVWVRPRHPDELDPYNSYLFATEEEPY